MLDTSSPIKLQQKENNLFHAGIIPSHLETHPYRDDPF
jgi:hypothetical protein